MTFFNRGTISELVWLILIKLNRIKIAFDRRFCLLIRGLFLDLVRHSATDH